MTVPAIQADARLLRSCRRMSWIGAVVIVCGMFLLAGPAPRLLAAANSSAQNSPVAQSDSHAAQSSQSALQAKRHARRQEEIRQKKIDNPEAEDGANVYRHSPTVHKLAHLLGLSVEQTSRLFETVNFILLMVGIVWLVARILPRTLRNRSERIRNEIQQARVATEDANRRLSSIEARLASLDGEIDAIKTKAEQETAAEEKRLRTVMEQEKQAILDAAAQDIAAAGNNAQNLLKNLAADLVIENAKRQIAVTPESDRSLVEAFLTDLNGKNENRPRGGVN